MLNYTRSDDETIVLVERIRPLLAGHLPEIQSAVLAKLAPLNRKTRWIAKRKASLLREIDSGEISEAEARRRYHLSAEELAEWRRHYIEGGVRALMEKQIPSRRSCPLYLRNTPATPGKEDKPAAEVRRRCSPGE